MADLLAVKAKSELPIGNFFFQQRNARDLERQKAHEQRTKKRPVSSTQRSNEIVPPAQPTNDLLRNAQIFLTPSPTWTIPA